MEHWEKPESAVSVLVPTYNRAHFLPETLDSILSQTYSPAEVIVVDDGSTDDTQAVISRLYPQVKYHRIDNSGVCMARNTAASFATSPYIAFCDSDDLWRPDKLEKQMELHLQYPDIKHSFTNFSIVTEGDWASETKFDGATPTFFSHCEKALDCALKCGASLYDELLMFQPVFPSTTLMSRDFFYRIGGYKDSLGRVLSEDLEFALRCVQHAPIGVITEPVVGIRKHTSNFSGSNFATTCGEIEILNYALLNHSVTLPTKKLMEDQIALRRVGASYGAFSEGRFAACKKLLSAVPDRYLTPKLRLKLLISNSPEPVARFLQKLLVRT
jgi:glycosyltransferase involved in cell wall biosynthesis